MDSSNLTREELDSALRLCGPRQPVGIVCSPRSYHLLIQLKAKDPYPEFGLPLLIDARMTTDESEAYYDLTEWRERCLEQAEWDEARTRYLAIS